MGSEKRILDFDKNELFLSSRFFQFIIDNATQLIPSKAFSESIQSFIESEGIYGLKSKKYPLDVLVKLIDICRKANSSNEQFYNIGNQQHELHLILSSLILKQIKSMIEWSEEMNLFRITLSSSDSAVSIILDLHKSISIDYQKILTPLMSIIRGFMDRLCSDILDEEIHVIENKSGLNISCTNEVLNNFDIVKFISDKQFVFSRIKSFIEKEKEESIIDKISYYLFKDIGFSVEEIAQKLNTSPRSLQRKLKEEDSNFRTIKELIRKQLSIKYLLDDSLTIYDVSMLLAYSERSAFEKAFKKWYGKNPSQYRKELG